MFVVYSTVKMRTTKRKKEWLDDGAFWRELYPFLFPKKRIVDADMQIEKALVGLTLHGNLDGDEYGANAERLIAIGRKPISKHGEKGPNGASRNSE